MTKVVLTRHRTLLHRKLETKNGVLFIAHDEDGNDNTELSITITHEYDALFGKPEILTITLQPGDLLNVEEVAEVPEVSVAHYSKGGQDVPMFNTLNVVQEPATERSEEEGPKVDYAAISRPEPGENPGAHIDSSSISDSSDSSSSDVGGGSSE